MPGFRSGVEERAPALTPLVQRETFHRVEGGSRQKEDPVRILTAAVLAICTIAGEASSSPAAELWTRYPGPWGGDVRALERVPDGPVYLGVGHHDAHGSSIGTGGGLYASRDGGSSWERTTLQGVAVAGITAFQGSVYVATFGGGVWRGSIEGAQWAAFNAGLDDLNARCILAAGDALLLGTTSGFLYLDSTNTWQPAGAPGGAGGVWAMVQAPWDGATVLAATDSAVWKSTDHGRSWLYSGQGVTQRAARCVAIGSAGICWAGSFDRWNGQAELYASADSGATWSVAFTPPDYHDAVWAVAVSPADPDIILIGTGCLGSGQAFVYRTDSGGQDWDQVFDSRFCRGRSIRATEFLSNQYVLIGCESAGGAYLSRDGGQSWEPAVEGLDAANVYAIALAGEDIVVGRGFSSALARGVQSGQAWIDMDPEFPSLFVRSMVVWPDDPERILTAAWNDAYLSRDGGGQWASQGLGSHGMSVSMSPADTSIVYYGGGDGLFVTPDGCQTWEGPHETLGWGVEVVTADPRDGDHAFASASGYLFETHDAGVAWDTLGTFACSAIEFHALDDMMVYLGTRYEGVYVSDDGGNIFEWAGAGLADPAVTALAVDPVNPAIIWAGTLSGVYKTLDRGETWVPDNAGLENRHILSLEVDAPAGIIRVGAYAGGLSWSPIDHQGTGERPVPSGRLLLSVAPVPTRGRIAISSPAAGSAARDPLEISLYSLDGRLIRQARFEDAGPGIWDLAEVPSGVYTLRGARAGRSGETLVIVTP